MNILKPSLLALMFGTFAIGMSYSPSSSALPIRCDKVTGCAGGDCHTYLICDDGSIYIVIE